MAPKHCLVALYTQLILFTTERFYFNFLCTICCTYLLRLSSRGAQATYLRQALRKTKNVFAIQGFLSNEIDTTTATSAMCSLSALNQLKMLDSQIKAS